MVIQQGNAEKNVRQSRGDRFGVHGTAAVSVMNVVELLRQRIHGWTGPTNGFNPRGSKAGSGIITWYTAVPGIILTFNEQ